MGYNYYLNENLQYLDLSYNYLQKLVLVNMNKLKILNLQNNLLTLETIYGSISSQLRKLILDFNSIHMINTTFITENNSLEILSIQSNEFLLNNSNVFQYLNKLKKLNLARNNIQIIPKGNYMKFALSSLSFFFFFFFQDEKYCLIKIC